MKTEMIEAHGVPAYWAQPEGEGPFPTVLVFFEAFGLNEHIRDVARRLAREGYVAIAPDFYHRLPEPRIAAYGDMERVAALASATPDEHIVEDVRAVLAHAKASPVVRTDRIGAIGFCMGGRMSVLAACHFPEEIRAVASFYGGENHSSPAQHIEHRPLFGHAHGLITRQQDGRRRQPNAPRLRRKIREKDRRRPQTAEKPKMVLRHPYRVESQFLSQTSLLQDIKQKLIRIAISLPIALRIIRQGKVAELHILPPAYDSKMS
jgi:dienelactone hydrolase